MTAQNGSMLTRRDFFTVGSLTLLSASVVGQEGWGFGGQQRWARVGSARVPIGYVPCERESAPRSKRLLERIASGDFHFHGNDDRSHNPNAPVEEMRGADPIAAMVDPASFEEGDHRFVESGVRLSVWGVVPTAFEDPPDTIDVAVLFEPFHPHAFTAWSYRRSPGWTVQSPCQMNVPVDPTHGMNLLVSMHWGNPRTKDERVVVGRELAGRVHFAVAPESGAPKLLPGVHLIPLFDSGRKDLARLSRGGAISEVTTPMLLLETQYGSEQATTPA